MKLLFILSLFCLGFVTHEPETTGKLETTTLKSIMFPNKAQSFGAVQTAANSSYFASSTSVTISSTTAGHLIVVTVYGATSESVSSVTDNQSNAYVVGSPVDNTERLYQCYGVSVVGGVTSVTVNHTNGFIFRVIVDVYSGGAANNTDVYDTRTTGTGSGTAMSVSTLTASATGNLMVASGLQSSGGSLTFTAGSGYTNYGNISGTVRTQYKLSGAATETAPWTLSSSTSWNEILQSYKPAPAATNTGRFFHFFKP